MSNEHYLIVSYFLVGLVSLCLGVAVYRVLRAPFATIAEAVAGRLRSRVLTRALGAFMTLAAVLGFLSVTYTEKGCRSYEEVVKDRAYLVQANQHQLQRTGDWIVSAVFVWCAVVLICLLTLRRPTANHRD
ncbi:MAG: hypothetical protein ACLPLR_17905 [Terriglobales bacterium]